ncbi:hypothetical protein C8J57DRAFT_1504901 [Mycena rebaudengoi]|nr:hypothetical protein C8J57DRAFT_1504901 [Mycena rebaudengoi]
MVSASSSRPSVRRPKVASGTLFALEVVSRLAVPDLPHVRSLARLLLLMRLEKDTANPKDLTPYRVKIQRRGLATLPARSSLLMLISLSSGATTPASSSRPRLF